MSQEKRGREEDEEDAWHTLRTVARYKGGARALLEAYVPAEEVVAAKAVPSFYSITGLLLATVLSYVERRDVKRVVQVCRAWSVVPHGRYASVFWKRMVETKMRQMWNCVPFDTFARMPQQIPTRWDETVRQQVEWIYLGDKWCRDATVAFQRRTHDLCVLTFYVGMGLKWYHGKYFQPFHIDRAKLSVTVDYLDGKGLMAFDEAQYDCETGNLWRVYSFGTQFIGRYYYDRKTQKIVPHGKGRWIFRTGRVYEGDDVAEYGKIKRPIKTIKT